MRAYVDWKKRSLDKVLLPFQFKKKREVSNSIPIPASISTLPLRKLYYSFAQRSKKEKIYYFVGAVPSSGTKEADLTASRKACPTIFLKNINK